MVGNYSYYYFSTQWYRKLCHDWVVTWFSWVELDRALWSLQRLNSTQLNWTHSQMFRLHGTCDNWISWVEMSSGLWTQRPIGLISTSWVELSWVELSPVGRCDQSSLPYECEQKINGKKLKRKPISMKIERRIVSRTNISFKLNRIAINALISTFNGTQVSPANSIQITRAVYAYLR